MILLVLMQWAIALFIVMPMPILASQGLTNATSPTASIPTNLVTRSGVTYKNITVIRAETDGIVINHTAGIAKVAFDDLPESLQRQYNYDPVKAAETRRQQAEAQAARRAAEQAPLEGQDLIAWKLARQAAERKCRELSTPHQVSVPYGAATRGSAAAYAIEANAHFAATAPTYAVVAEPQRRFMTKSNTGDWTFVIPVKSTYYNVEKKTRVPEWERMLVKVTNYGSEIRVESIQLLMNK